MTKEYLEKIKINNLPRLPFEGRLDLTYRCNNNCRHCWLLDPAHNKRQNEELSFVEIKKIVDEAKKLGCRRWSVSGGEPMLRPDFPEILEYITSNSISYSLNTNGTLITPKIAKLMQRKGIKMVALYGATEDVHDQITRRPGSFEETMRGFRYLKEAGAGFTVQIIPMRDNYHQFQDMLNLAQSLSKNYRIGAAWLYLSASGDEHTNAEILRQRLSPSDVIELDKPDLSHQQWAREEKEQEPCRANANGHFFSACIKIRRDFHIDPYGQMSFCCFIKDPAMRYDLRKGNLKECWENFIPSLEQQVKSGEEYNEYCGSCAYREDCRWCPVYGYLEHRRFSAKVDYLCAAAKENKKFKENWEKAHRRYYKIADITIQVDSDLPISDGTFHPKFKLFEADGPGEDTVRIRHHFGLPDLDGRYLGQQQYRKAPWAIYKHEDSWIYLGISPRDEDKNLHRVAVFNHDYSRGKLYDKDAAAFKKGNLHSLTFFPTDQILLAQVLAEREGCYLHSCGVNLGGKGLLFVGHSEAGKSTMANMLKGKAEILCDDRIIVRKKDGGFRIYGTWSHGDVPDVSCGSASLKAVFFLEKAEENRLIPFTDKREVAKHILRYVIRPFVTTDWWERTLLFVERISHKIPFYMLHFDKRGKVDEILRTL